ncbi:MAG: AAA ATPase [Marteilia pararefringens]
MDVGESNSLINAKKQLKCSTHVEEIVCRDDEKRKIEECLSVLGEKSPSNNNFSIYVYGLPGSGKTSLITSLTNKYKSKLNPVFINCSNVRGSIFKEISKILKVNITHSDEYRSLVKHLSSKRGLPVLLILDEIDSLKHKDDLNLCCELPGMTYCKIGVISISNNLALSNYITNRDLITISFPPYTFQQIFHILQTRVQQFEVFSSQAIQICARKIAKSGGDIRKACSILEATIDKIICESSRSEEIADKENIAPTLVKDNLSGKSGHPKATSGKFFIGEQCVLEIIEKIDASLFNANIQGEGCINSVVQLPVQQQIALCAIFLFYKTNSAKNECSTSEIYHYIKQNFDMPSIKRNINSEARFTEMCQILDGHSIIHCKPNNQCNSLLVSIDSSQDLCNIVNSNILQEFNI